VPANTTAGVRHLLSCGLQSARLHYAAAISRLIRRTVPVPTCISAATFNMPSASARRSLDPPFILPADAVACRSPSVPCPLVCLYAFRIVNAAARAEMPTSRKLVWSAHSDCCKPSKCQLCAANRAGDFSCP
jgi:hypothetical protein